MNLRLALFLALSTSACVRTVSVVNPQPSVLQPNGKIALKIAKDIPDDLVVENSNVTIEGLRASVMNGFVSGFGEVVVTDPKAADVVFEVQRLNFREEVLPALGFFLTLKMKVVLRDREGNQIAQCAGTLKPGAMGVGDGEVKGLLEQVFEVCAGEFFKTTGGPSTPAPVEKDTSKI